MAETITCFDDLKKRIYTLYVRISKEHFFNSEPDVCENEFDTLLAHVCVAHLSEDITTLEFNELSGYLVRTYEIYRLRKETS